MPGFSAYGGNGGYYGGGSGYFGGNPSYSPATSYGFPTLGASAGSQGLPYGAGFNQVSGAPLGPMNAAAYSKQQADANSAYYKAAVDAAGGSGNAASAPLATAFAPATAGRSAGAVSFAFGANQPQGPSSYGSGNYSVPSILPQPQYMTADSFSGAKATITPQMQGQLNRTLWGQESGPAIAGQWVTWQKQAEADRMMAGWNRAAAQAQANAANAQMRNQYDQSQLSYNRLLQDYANQEGALDGYGQAQLADIARRYGGYEGKTVQNAISRGLAPQYAPVGTFEAGRAGTPLASMLRGLRYDQEQANNAANEDINTQKTALSSNRLQAYERILAAQANQANQFAQLQLERDRLAQQASQFQQSLAARNTGAGFGGGGSSGGGRSAGGGGSSGGLPNLGQTGILNQGQLDRFGYYAGNVNYGAPSGVLGGMYSGPSSFTGGGFDPYYSPGSTYGGNYEYGNVDFGGTTSPADLFAGGGNFGDWGTGFDYMGG